ncbi:MAG: TonB-dependent receptor plug domain-containing protein [Prevotellaceae bacterium]|jgi:hypothetical protein|nr:TonB-dependent receptor plug domain-containing protein [Prevotellaceae bacterium]
MKAYLTLIILFCSVSLFGQEIEAQKTNVQEENPFEEKMYRQLKSFPQEKVYLHTDKTIYVSGEQIWFRAFLVEAVLHRPAFASRYIYVELISPAGELIVRNKIRPDEDSLFHNKISLREDLPEGTYLIRAYTNFMRNRPDYFFQKKIFVADPQAFALQINPQFAIEEKRGSVSVQFLDYENQPVEVKNLTVRIDTGNMKKLDVEDKFSFKIIPGKQQTIYVEFDCNERKYKKYIPVPAASSEFDVAFFPEGGYLVDNALCRLGFKALNSNGLSEDVSGEVFDDKGNPIVTFQSIYKGMGSFSFFPEKGQKYQAVCKNKAGNEKRFQLPASKADACVLKTNWSKNKLYITLLKGREFREQPLNLFIHVRGMVIFSGKWSSQNTVSIDKSMFPSGVVQILLLDDKMNPLSERLAFCLNQDELTRTTLSVDKTAYASKERVSAKVRVTDAADNPLTGNFSVAVTDDSDVAPDTTFTILSNLLLCSDIKGYVESPEYYLNNASAADVLMITQGWRRYNIPAVLADSVERPSQFLELGQEISGTVKQVIGRKVKVNNPVSLLAPQEGHISMTQTDENGRFFFNGFEYPDSTLCVVQALSKKGGAYVELLLDPETFPPVETFPVPEFGFDSLFRKYVEKSDRKYTDEYGLRSIVLESVTITGQKPKPNSGSIYSSMMNTGISSDKFANATNLAHALMLLSGIWISGDKVSIRGSSTPPVFIVDDVIWDDFRLDDIEIRDVDRIEVMKGAEAAVLGSRGAGGAIIITTKTGEITKDRIKFNIKSLFPKGYSAAAEFYSPKYETEESKTGIDRRTTIFWKPNVVLSDGNAEFEFYTADTETTYSVIIEGLTANGQIIRQIKKEEIKKER